MRCWIITPLTPQHRGRMSADVIILGDSEQVEPQIWITHLRCDGSSLFGQLQPERRRVIRRLHRVMKR
jgi:hypothetical protein